MVQHILGISVALSTWACTQCLYSLMHVCKDGWYDYSIDCPHTAVVGLPTPLCLYVPVLILSDNAYLPSHGLLKEVSRDLSPGPGDWDQGYHNALVNWISAPHRLNPRGSLSTWMEGKVEPSFRLQKSGRWS